MNGKQAKALRKVLELEKQSPASKSGLSVEGDKLMFTRRSNPQRNLYRKMKKIMTRKK